ncbi:MAG: ComEC/Rec2 family competence protein, partial [Anaerolineales bacterium]
GLLGRLLGRRQTGANSLAFTAALMTLFNPQLPWDVSFQLSFTATLGLVLYAEPLQDGLNRLLAQRIDSNLARRISLPISEYFLFTLAAQVTTLPVILYHFHRLSLTALVANPLILPPQPLVMILGGVAVLAGIVFLPLGKLLGLLAWAPAAYTVRIVEWLARIPQGARTLGEFSLGWVILFYAVLLGVTLWHRPIWAVRRKLTSWALMGGAGLLAAGVWSLALSAPDGRLHLTVLNVPDGPAVLVESPSGRTVLIGGSSSANALGSALARRLPLLGQNLDALIIPSKAASSMKALPGIIERFSPQMVLWTEEKAGSAAARNVVRVLEKQNHTTQMLQSGQRLQLDEKVTLHVLGVSSKTVVLLLEYGAFTALFPGESQGAELPQGARVLVLMQKIVPSDGHVMPSAQIIINCTASEIEAPNGVMCAPIGWVEVITDGHQMWVSRGE